ncbi:MAG: hypothetical protein HY319_15660, partial [Armatimonadetes bacterium]|nr:hypothetical protein [Armatimonadota bacterium]
MNSAQAHEARDSHFVSSFRVPASLAGAILLLARQLVPAWEGWPRTRTQTLALVGAGKSQAYEFLSRLWALLPSLLGHAGRPSAVSSEPIASTAILKALYAYLCEHPGSVCGRGRRRVYSDGFRRLVVDLIGPGRPGEGMTVEELASASIVPLGTLKDWLRTEPAGSSPEEAAPDVADTRAETSASLLDGIRSAHLQLIATLWQSWEGTFQAFCAMVRTEYRVPHGMTFIGNFLQAIGLRTRRPQLPEEAPWSSGTYEIMFPGAQWLGDGTSIAVHWHDRRTGRKLMVVYNVEAFHDPAADATVGFAVTKSENEEALRQAYEAAKETAGHAPLGVTLDRKPCNHSPGAQEIFDDTVLLQATPSRGQAKAPLEGAFGLFKQALPRLLIEGGSLEDRIGCVLGLILTAWWRGRNGKPRKRFGGLTPAEFYAGFRPTEEQVEETKKWLRRLERRQEKMRLTRQASADPVRVEVLRRGLAELGISDPGDRLARRLARYGRDAIAWGLATYRAKLERETLPPTDYPERYLGGIIRNLDTRLELELLADYLLEQRIRLRDIALKPLQQAADRLRAEQPPQDLPKAFVDQALGAGYVVDFQFWTRATTEALEALPAEQRLDLYKPL